MSDELKPIRDPQKEIKMKIVDGTDMLQNCYFYPTDEHGVFLLSTEDDHTLAVVTDGQPFMFKHDGYIWKVPNPQPNAEPFRINRRAASGSWWNNSGNRPHSKERGSSTDEDGTFTAMASGGAEEDTNAASAGAY